MGAFDNPNGLVEDVKAIKPANLGTAKNPLGTVYANQFVGAVAGQEVLANNIYVDSKNAAGSANLDLLGADATDNTVLNVATGKVGKFAVNKVTTGTFDNNSIDFPAFNLLDGSDKNYSLTIYAAGTPYTVTATSSALTFGTTNPTITFDKAGTYLLLSRTNYEFVGSTFAANRSLTTKLRRTNNTAGDLTNSPTVIGTNVVTTVNGVLQNVVTPPILYVATIGDIITVFADVSVVPTAGSLQATEASIVAIRLF